MRNYTLARTVTAGCDFCGKRWAGPNAQGVAARHHDAHGHITWVRVVMEIRYGGGGTQNPPPSQPSLLGGDNVD